MTLDELKLYLRIDGTFEDVLLTSLQMAAEEYLKSAGVLVNYENRLYHLCVMLLVNHWYSNREGVVIGTITKEMEFSLRAIIQQLQLGSDIVGTV